MTTPISNNDTVLCHYGIKGMKWGIRRFQKKDGSSTAPGKQRQKENTDSGGEKETTIRSLSDEEIRSRISRLKLEKDYADLIKSTSRNSKGREFVLDVLEKSGKNIATQFTIYAMGSAVNKLAGKEIVNPKKGQKDK